MFGEETGIDVVVKYDQKYFVHPPPPNVQLETK